MLFLLLFGEQQSFQTKEKEERKFIRERRNKKIQLTLTESLAQSRFVRQRAAVAAAVEATGIVVQPIPEWMRRLA